MLEIPTSLPLDVSRLNLTDPLVQRIAAAAVGLIFLAIVLRVIGRWRSAAAAARMQAELRRGREELRMQQEEIKRLAESIVATSSTARIPGYAIVRQVETVFTDARPSSVAALELLKALAAQKGANAIVNLQTQQTPSGKWVANGDGVVVRLLTRTGPGRAPAR